MTGDDAFKEQADYIIQQYTDAANATKTSDAREHYGRGNCAMVDFTTEHLSLRPSPQAKLRYTVVSRAAKFAAQMNIRWLTEDDATTRRALRRRLDRARERLRRAKDDVL